jgi:hypothetical protein
MAGVGAECAAPADSRQLVASQGLAGRRTGTGAARDTRLVSSANLALVRSIDPQIEYEYVGGPEPGSGTGPVAMAAAMRSWVGERE